MRDALECERELLGHLERCDDGRFLFFFDNARSETTRDPLLLWFRRLGRVKRLLAAIAFIIFRLFSALGHDRLRYMGV